MCDRVYCIEEEAGSSGEREFAGFPTIITWKKVLQVAFLQNVVYLGQHTKYLDP